MCLYFTKHEELRVFHPNTEKWDKKIMHTDFKVFGYQMKHSFKCLILELIIKITCNAAERKE